MNEISLFVRAHSIEDTLEQIREYRERELAMTKELMDSLREQNRNLDAQPGTIQFLGNIEFSGQST